ncbi:MAG: hypothetical protein JJ896_07495 [Rhodothermales bacterium]|nr:hypothetical protein [Rhodothermales bacterium]MBO6779482.1 hypothetical protein [Rhodothermales bacterium]
MNLRLLPIYGIAAGFGLFAVASSLYPGGTGLDPDSVGYSWSHNFISALFAPEALNGEANPGRPFAVAALLLWCLSLGVSFKRISDQPRSRGHRKLIEIAGIGAAVYAALVATPMHDLMVRIGLVFSLTALLTTVHFQYTARAWKLAAWGVLSLGLSVLSATLYLTGSTYEFMPVIQKANVLSVVLWILFSGYADLGSD